MPTMRLSTFAALALPTMLAFGACQSPMAGSATTSHEATSMEVPASFPGWDSFGEDFIFEPKADNTVTFSDVAANSDSYDGKTIRMTATIDEVCQTKGCWMTFSDGENEMRVKFKNYAFFMPMDSMGRTAVIEGEFNVKMVPADEAAHYLEDAGKPEEAALITEDQLSMTFMASSVLIEQ